MSLAPLRTLRDLLNGGRGPASTALVVVDSGKTTLRVSRAQLSKAVEQAAWRLRELGVGGGDVVSIAMGNTAAYVVVFLAATWIRAVAAPLNPNLKAGEYAFYMQDVGSKVLVVEAGPNDAEAAQAAAELGVPLVHASEFCEPEQGVQLSVAADRAQATAQPLSSATYTADPPQPTDVALYLHTSGTTSRPKLVPLSHHNLCTSMGNIRNTYELDEKDTCYLVMPLFHVHGLIGGLFSTLCSGGTVVLPRGGRFSAQAFWVDVIACGATWYTAVPTIHQILLQRKEQDQGLVSRASLRFVRSCSSALAPAVLGRLEEYVGAPVLEAYAMTEASHMMTSNPLPKNGPHKAGTVGRAANVQVAILDDRNRMVSAAGVVGQVCIRGENVTAGYINRPEANLSEFAGGWFHTGDQGFLDKDGYLTLTGRLKELINRGGEKIAPLEVDAVLLAHPSVGEAVAFGLPDEKYGEIVCAAVVPRTGCTLSPEEVIAFCAERLSREKVPARVFVTQQVPKTATGKVQRRFVAEAFGNSASKL